jgi:hypothetical protein
LPYERNEEEEEEEEGRCNQGVPKTAIFYHGTSRSKNVPPLPFFSRESSP